ncbi:histidinol-phosphatase, inositol monophosphatase family [Salinihabitans flavidus]|uniref:Histidinol-phosphatase, inositol monophosphatase family n=1 Tax=Salinihabitans flavidus TaxID=569882 RepID=A0A1H8QIX6_9RHOB|nr:inositol monophosphatase family protein [Salinihabitans flavidus]SEO54179.1 histidinol-phosphatase, inositol monophosphatase family [Salinihabitans flavidus]
MVGFDRAEIADVAGAAADAAGAVILPYFRQMNLGMENKDAAGFDPVTIADRAAEEAMRDVLSERRPGDGILGEELGFTEGDTGLTWVLDPIDGTRGFISGTPTWGVLVALSDATGPRFGLMDQPYIGERFVGGLGYAEMHGPLGRRPLKTRAVRNLGDATLFTTFPEVGSQTEAVAFRAVSERVQLTRYGMDCYAYALLAAGQVDLVIEAGLNAYDVHAPIALIEAAGGVVTNWTGGPAHGGGRILAAATPGIHAQAIDILMNY